MATPREQVYMSTFAIDKDLKEPLRVALAKLGVKGYSDLLTMIALHGDEVATALTPLAQRYLAEKPVVHRGKGKTTKAKEALAGALHDEVEAVLAQLGLGSPP